MFHACSSDAADFGMSALDARHCRGDMLAAKASWLAPTYRRRFFSLVLLAATTSLAACGGGGGGAPPSPPGPVTLSATSLVFLTVGPAASQNVTAAESNYSGTFSATSSNCSGIATATPQSGSTLTVFPIGSGACTYTITGAPGQSQSLAISVTTTAVGGN